MDAKTVSGFALVAVSVGVAVGFLASSTTNLHVSSAVRPAVTSRPAVVSATPSFRGVPHTQVSASQVDIPEAADVQFVQSAASTGASTWATGAFLAAAGAVGAALLAIRQKAHSAYQTIQEDPEAVVAQAGRALGVAVTSAALAGSASAASLTYDEIQSLSYMEMKGTGLSNTCPIISDSTGNKLSLKAGKYSITNMCLEPSSFQVKVPSPDGKTVTDFERTKLMTRLTYTLDGIRADLDVANDGSWNIQEIDGIDYAATTVQLAGGERVPFLFTVKNLAAKGDGSQFLGQFDVPSYRGATFLDPKGRGGATGYDTAVALPAAGDDEEYSKENTKSAAGAVGTIAFKVAKVNTETGEIAGVFESIQPSDTDLGSKVPKDVKTSGVWYGQISPA